MTHPLKQPPNLSPDEARPRTDKIDPTGWHTHPFPWSHPTMLAPMEGVSHPTFRALMTETPGVGIVCTEFVRVTEQRARDKALAKSVVKAPGLPLSVQVMGNSIENMASAAGAMARHGADVVDINLGCPSPRVVRKGVGSAMLKDIDLLRRVLSAMRTEVPGLLSAKIRAGFDDADGVLAIGHALQEAGIDFLVVHPRRSKQFYSSVADWRIIAALKEALTIPVVGNGDIWYAVDAFRMRAETGCDAVMIGRPALRNPWIFEQIAALASGERPRAPTGDDLVERLHLVAERYLSVYPAERLVIGKLKEWLTYTARAVSPELRLREVLREAEVAPLLRELEARLAGLGADEVDLQATGHLGYERRGTAKLTAT